MSSRFSYQRLKYRYKAEKEEEQEEEEDDDDDNEKEMGVGRAKRWLRVRKFPSKRRSRVLIPGLRRFLKRKSKLVSSLRGSVNKVLKRLNESRSHLGDLFSGNYGFVQVSPSPLKCYWEKSFMVHDHGLVPTWHSSNLRRLA